jgi:hypothetical protein
MSAGERLVGRDAALAVLRATLDGAAGGRGEVALLAGEAGIGKTALAAELARQAAGAGARVLWGQCWQGEAVPAYWPWVQVLRAATEAAPAVALGDAARLLPGASDADAAGAAAGPVEEPAAARFRLFDAVVRVLAALAARQPLLVVLDDLHWADEASLRLLQFAARHLARSPVLLLGTYRDLEAPARLHELAGAGQVVALAGLDPAEVATLLEAVTGRRPSEALAAGVWRRTGGNPFFVRELARLQAAQPTPDGGPGPTPPVLDGIRDTLERRLARLSQPCVEVLAVAAVAGPQIGVEVLTRVLPGRGPDLADLLEEAVRARVLTAPAVPLGPYLFTHDLFRETVYGGLPAAQRTGLHLAVGRALEELRAEGGGVHAAELAAHHLAAASAGATAAAAEAVRWSALASREAVTRLAFEDARDHAERALAALDLVEPPDPAARLELLGDLAEARALAGDGPGARATHLEAAALARRLGHGAGLARAAVGVHALGAPTGSARDQQLALLGEAAALAGQRTPLLARVLACLARELHHSWEEDNLARAPAVAAEAVAMARELEDPATLSFALLALHDARWRPGSARERVAVVEEMLALAAAAGDRELLAQARLLRAVALVELGDRGGLADLEEHCRLADELGHATARWAALSRRAAAAGLAGRLEEARALGEEARQLGRRIGQPDADSVAASQLWELGRFDGRRSAAGANPSPAPADWPAWRAILLVEAGDPEAARAAMAGFDPDRWILRPGVVRSHDPWPLLVTAEAAALAGDERQRAASYRALRPLAGGHTVLGGFVAYTGAADHYLGLLAAALGRPEEAAGHLRVAVELHQRLGATAWAARSREHLERLEQPAGQPTCVFRRDGDVWTLTFDGVSVHLPDSKGLRDLATLLGAPGEQVHAVRLLGGRPPTGGADPVLDDQARAAYRARLAELDAELDQADAAGDPDRAGRARAEREALVAELSRAVGLGGRPRRLGDDTERARKAVSARISDAIARIERASPALGRHLRQSVATGTSCSYTPSEPVQWRL